MVRTWHLCFSLASFFIFSSANLILDFNIADSSTIFIYKVSYTTANCRRKNLPLYAFNNWRITSFFCYEKSLFRFYAFFWKACFCSANYFLISVMIATSMLSMFHSSHISRWAISSFSISFMHIWFCIRRLWRPHYLYPSRLTCSVKC